jgi:hypothetical protein
MTDNNNVLMLKHNRQTGDICCDLLFNFMKKKTGAVIFCYSFTPIMLSFGHFNILTQPFFPCESNFFAYGQKGVRFKVGLA